MGYDYSWWINFHNFKLKQVQFRSECFIAYYMFSRYKELATSCIYNFSCKSLALSADFIYPTKISARSPRSHLQPPYGYQCIYNLTILQGYEFANVLCVDPRDQELVCNQHHSSVIYLAPRI